MSPSNKYSLEGTERAVCTVPEHQSEHETQWAEIGSIEAKRNAPYAAIVPVSRAVRNAPGLTELRGSAHGCYGDAARYTGRIRDEWQ